MEYALSLCQSTLLHARAVSYDDCRELQIVCPACHEALFKRGSAFTKREYFCHYTAKSGAECELRVRAIVKEALATTVAIPKGQDLQRFLSRFEEIVIDHLGGFGKAILPVTERMRRRVSFRQCININQRRFGTELPRAIKMLDAAEFSETVVESVGDVCKFLVAINSFKALIFAIACGLAIRHVHGRILPGFNPSHQKDDPRDLMLVKGLVLTSNTEFDLWTGTLDKQEAENSRRMYVDGSMRDSVPIRIRCVGNSVTEGDTFG